MSKRLGAGLIVDDNGDLSFGGIEEDAIKLEESYKVVNKPIGWWSVGDFYL